MPIENPVEFNKEIPQERLDGALNKWRESLNDQELQESKGYEWINEEIPEIPEEGVDEIVNLWISDKVKVITEEMVEDSWHYTAEDIGKDEILEFPESMKDYWRTIGPELIKVSLKRVKESVKKKNIEIEDEKLLNIFLECIKTDSISARSNIRLSAKNSVKSGSIFNKSEEELTKKIDLDLDHYSKSIRNNFSSEVLDKLV